MRTVTLMLVLILSCSMSCFAVNETGAAFDAPATRSALIYTEDEIEAIASRAAALSVSSEDIKGYTDIVCARAAIFSKDILDVLNQPEQFIRDVRNPDEKTIHAVVEELLSIIDCAPRLPSDFYHFRVEKTEFGNNYLVYFRYSSGGLGSPGDYIITKCLAPGARLHTRPR